MEGIRTRASTGRVKGRMESWAEPPVSSDVDAVDIVPSVSQQRRSSWREE
jgi:hypothetical protein